MGRFPGSGGGHSGGLLWMVMQTPWISYVFLVLLLYFLLSAYIEQRKVLGFVQITIWICIPIVALFKDAQGYGIEYWAIWVAGLTGCLAYWVKWMIDKTPANIN